MPVLLLIVGMACMGGCAQNGTTASNGADENVEIEAGDKTEAYEMIDVNAGDQTMIIEKYLKDNGIKYNTSPDGVIYSVDNAGDAAAKPVAGDFVKVHYTGKLMSDGSTFDSSVDKDIPFAFPVGQGRVIPGWDKGIPLFGKGGKGTLYLPAAMAYGQRDIPSIPANSILVFDIEVLDILDEAGYNTYMQEAQGKYMEWAKGEEVKQLVKDKEILADHAKANKLDIKFTESGLGYIIDEPGTGKQAVAGVDVLVHYTGTLLNGKKFDSSVDRGEPFSFPLGQGRVIKGWDEGIQLFKEGGKGKLFIPSSLGYGARGAGADIPANACLIFDVELVKVN